jgi:hypothetical protein
LLEEAAGRKLSKLRYEVRAACRSALPEIWALVGRGRPRPNLVFGPLKSLFSEAVGQYQPFSWPRARLVINDQVIAMMVLAAAHREMRPGAAMHPCALIQEAALSSMGGGTGPGATLLHEALHASDTWEVGEWDMTADVPTTTLRVGIAQLPVSADAVPVSPEETRLRTAELNESMAQAMSGENAASPVTETLDKMFAREWSLLENDETAFWLLDEGWTTRRTQLWQPRLPRLNESPLGALNMVRTRPSIHPYLAPAAVVKEIFTDDEILFDFDTNYDRREEIPRRLLARLSPARGEALKAWLAHGPNTPGEGLVAEIVAGEWPLVLELLKEPRLAAPKLTRPPAATPPEKGPS